nr:alpha/beta-hydrolase family protein [Ectothiorhodospira magna]
MHKIRDFVLDLAKGFSVVGLLVGTLFFAFSLTPSLVPRPFGIQGLISGLSFTAGYGVGFFFRWLWIYLGLPVPRRRNELILKSLAALGCAVVVVTFLWQATEWQNTLRDIMDMEPSGGMPTVGIGLMTLLIFTVLLVVVRLFKHTFLFLSRRLQRFVPTHVSHVVGVLVSAMLFWSLIDGVIFSLALRAADNSYQQVDALIQDDLARPEDPLKTGSSASLISWTELGRQGRNFISSGPTAADIAAFIGEPALEPLRVYVGLNAADTAHERARLALAELKRVGGFERSVLLLVTPTGTGWVDPAALDTVEYLHRGDIATVTAQYSYLPSALSLIVEGEYGAEMARALFEKVYGYWTRLPQDARPALYLHGLSLGALNSDRSFDVYDIIQDPFDGALWSGPPFRSETWRKATQERDPDSPAWLPRFRDGAVVRFMNQTRGLNDEVGEWGKFRIAYLQYASDPVTFFDTHAFFREPEWMLPPRGPDVSPDLRWYPIVTMLQLAADMAVGSTPPGYGHTFAAEHYIEAWYTLTEPQGWSTEALERLKARFAR